MAIVAMFGKNGTNVAFKKYQPCTIFHRRGDTCEREKHSAAREESFGKTMKQMRHIIRLP
jgi:hypothetical protein